MSKHKQYDPEPMKRYLLTLLRRTGESYRRASLAAGLPNNAIAKYMRGIRPGRLTCILLASHFGVNPNDLLQLAGHDPLPIFQLPELENRIDPNIRELAMLLQQIEDPAIRIQVVEALKKLANLFVSL
jgi:hypothetical protein